MRCAISRHGRAEETRSSRECGSGLCCPAHELCARAAIASAATRDGSLLGEAGWRRAEATREADELR